jgi:ComF family protein
MIKNSCQCCGLPLLENSSSCGDCLNQELPFDQTIAVFNYQYPIQNFLWELKFGGKLAYAQTLGLFLSEKIISYYSERTSPEAIIPVPLHFKRLQKRGFNQALEIARPAARKLKIPLITKSVIRKKNTQAQSSLAVNRRKQNIKNAFLVVRFIPWKHVAVVDDVVTTGNTINEFCSTLKKNGVEKIDVWCLARTKKNNF